MGWSDPFEGIYRRLPINLTGLYLEPDGSLPNHGLDPLQPENRAELQRKVIELGADIGFAFDGDGDRFFAIDDRGQVCRRRFSHRGYGRVFSGKASWSKNTV